jgi:hypothetical protein
MTVDELIAQLKTYPKNMRVLCADSEGGYRDIENVNTFAVVFDVYESKHNVQHECALFMDDSPGPMSQWRKNQNIKSGVCVILGGAYDSGDRAWADSADSNPPAQP